MTCSSERARRFGGTYCPHLQGRRISQSKKSTRCYDPEDRTLHHKSCLNAELYFIHFPKYKLFRLPSIKVAYSIRRDRCVATVRLIVYLSAGAGFLSATESKIYSDQTGFRMRYLLRKVTPSCGPFAACSSHRGTYLRSLTKYTTIQRAHRKCSTETTKFNVRTGCTTEKKLQSLMR
jgi:hypothetical protein